MLTMNKMDRLSLFVIQQIIRNDFLFPYKLLAFQHKMLRKIQKMNMYVVQAYHITNKQVQENTLQ